MTYMAKSHEDKLRAVKEAEDKKNIEIQALKRQIEEAKSGGGSSGSIVTTGITDGQIADESSLEAVSKKLLAYQTFMSRYIVSAQEEKRKAILAAEETISRKYEDRLSAFLLGGVTALNVVPAPVPVERPTKSLTELKLQKKEVKREIKEMEREMKNQTNEKTVPPPATPKVEAPTIAEGIVNAVVPPEVVEADHGLRADGGVGGLTLAERVLQGAEAQSLVPPHEVDGSADAAVETALAMHPMEKVYLKRNAIVAAAAKAGVHNRWGVAEEMLAAVAVKKGMQVDVGVVSPLVLTPRPEGMLTPSTEALASSTEVVNGSTADAMTPLSAADPLHQVYYKRNVGIASAVDAGVHNRWGPAEEELAKDYVVNALTAGAEANPVYIVPPEVEEADHGLRADGGVGGPSLADRVNLGAQLLGS